MRGPLDDHLREMLVFDDETMLRKKKRRNEGGGLLFLGVCFILMGIAHALFLEILYDSRITWIVISAVVILIGIVSLVFGIKIFNQVGPSLAEFWAENNGYTKDEIMEFVRECRMDGTMAVHTEIWDDISGRIPESIYDLAKEQAIYTGLITPHWFRAPDTCTIDIMRIIDIAAIWYEPKELFGHYNGVYYVKSNGKQKYFRSFEDTGNWIVSEISKRNPMTITAPEFQFEGVTYNAYKNPNAVAALYCSECAKRRQETEK